MTDALILTDGVVENSLGYFFTDLGIWIAKEEKNCQKLLLEYGFASQPRKHIFSPRVRAARLPDGILLSIVKSIHHNVSGMSAVLVALIIISIISLFANLIILIFLVGVLALIFFSIIAHEAGHVTALRLVAPNEVGVLVSRGIRCYLVRRALSHRNEFVVITSGSIAPLLVTPLFVPFLFVVPLIFCFWLSVAFGHVCMLAFPTGDGKNLRKLYGRNLN